MKLTLSDIKSITKGALSIQESTFGFIFQRMTQQQLSAVADVPRYRNRAQFCAGIRFDFWTDGEALTFDYEILAFDESRNFFGFDIYVDNVLMQAFSEKPIVHPKGTLHQTLPSSESLHHITIYLPYSANCAVKNFILHKAAQLHPAEAADGILLCYGDSITQGYDALHPSLTYAAILARSLNMDLYNQGISGYVFDSNTIDSEHICCPDIVTAAYGTNDWTNKGSLKEIKSDIKDYLAKLVQAFPKSILYVILPIWRADFVEITDAGSFVQVIEILEASAMEYPRLRVLDGQKAFPHCKDFFADELLHPNDTGMLLYSQWLKSQIQKL